MTDSFLSVLLIVQLVVTFAFIGVVAIDFFRGNLQLLTFRLGLAAAVTVLALIRQDLLAFVIFSLNTAMTADVWLYQRKGNH